MKILFCDWNGTLLKDVDLWHEAMSHVFLAFDKQPPGALEYFQELATNEDWRGIYEKNGILAPSDEINGLYRPAYKARMHAAKLSYGAKTTLKRLKRNGILLVLITAQYEELVAPLLDTFSMRDLFINVFFHAVDKKAFMQMVMREHKVCPEDCYMISDTPFDVRHAKQAGVTAIGFLNRANSEISLRAAGADYCIHAFDELASII